jgi:translation elongation factor P/translation initiation factor 5A
MVPASDLKTGTILQIEKNLYQVLATEYHMGCRKMSSLQDQVYKPATLSNGMQI